MPRSGSTVQTERVGGGFGHFRKQVEWKGRRHMVGSKGEEREVTSSLPCGRRNETEQGHDQTEVELRQTYL